ncbi:unnamed protein product [Owenia fusiformis]|uniref:Uncharacterized protein n=1 Tax=Owenia fusiformis TaxID=6347 RepID=A0A8J1XUI7_OWEFU|nr:unnamed protein product [Owenia fusiformis]
MLKVAIPRFRRVEEDGDKGSYTVYCVDVYVNGRQHSVEKRYSEFEDLHKHLKRTIRPPVFPPKKFQNWNPKVLEKRKQGLEEYLQGIVQQGMIPKSLCHFLDLNATLGMGSEESLDQLDYKEPSHQPLLAFTEDPFIHAKTDGILPDIVVDGVNMGLYGSVEDMR